jgi:hypothetical protein
MDEPERKPFTIAKIVFVKAHSLDKLLSPQENWGELQESVERSPVRNRQLHFQSQPVIA